MVHNALHASLAFSATPMAIPSKMEWKQSAKMRRIVSVIDPVLTTVAFTKFLASGMIVASSSHYESKWYKKLASLNNSTYLDCKTL